MIVVIVSVLAVEPTRRRNPPARFGPANRVTLGRAVMVGCVAAFIGPAPESQAAFWVAMLAMLTLAFDGVDGFVARRTRSESVYGARFDMELDSLFMLVLSLLVWQWNRAGVWVLFCGCARYVWVFVMLFLPWFSRQLPPSFRRRCACVVGVLGLVGALPHWFEPWVNVACAVSATIALVISFCIDAVWLWVRRAKPCP